VKGGSAFWFDDNRLIHSECALCSALPPVGPDPSDIYFGHLNHASPAAWANRFTQLYLGALVFGVRAYESEGSLKADLWVLDRTLRILFGEVGQVVKGIRQSITKRSLSGPKRKTLNAVANYLYRNRSRMRYNDGRWPGRSDRRFRDIGDLRVCESQPACSFFVWRAFSRRLTASGFQNIRASLALYSN